MAGEVINLRGNTLIVSKIQADSLSGTPEDGSVTDDAVAADAEISGTKIEISSLTSTGESLTVSGDLETVLQAIINAIDPS